MEELIKQFGIDWKLLLAQAINFFVLLYLLKRFAYGPIIKVLKERKEKIAEGIKASVESKEILERAKEEKAAILLEAEEESIAAVSAAEDKADEQAKRIIDSAHQKSEQVILSGQRKLEEDRTKMAQEVKVNAQELVRTALRNVIGKMHPDEKDKMLIHSAVEELKSKVKI